MNITLIHHCIYTLLTLHIIHPYNYILFYFIWNYVEVDGWHALQDNTKKINLIIDSSLDNTFLYYWFLASFTNLIL
jgi:hypothetical protein